MGLYRLTEGEAFNLLRIASQGTNRKVHALALDVIETGTLELPELGAANRRRTGS
jgi:hypothetical protein